MFILITILAILFAILAWRDLKTALILLAALLPAYLLRFAIGPIPSTALEVIILIAFAIWFIKFKAWKISPWSYGKYIRPLLLLLAAASFAVVVAKDTIGAFGIWKAYFIEPAMVFLMMRSAFNEKKDWMNALKALGITSIALSVIAIYQYISGSGIPVPWDVERRVTSVFDFPNALGLFLAPIISIAIVLADIKKSWFWIMVSIFGLIAVILSQTEAALVAIPFALLITLLISGASKEKKIALTLLFITGFTLAVGSSALVREKLLLQDYSGQVRLSQWSETTNLIAANIPFGVGLSEYPTAVEPFHDPTLYEIFQYPHNIFLNIWVELGLLGLFAFFWLAWRVIKTIRLNKNDELKLAAFAALLTMVIHGLVDVPYFKNDLSVMVWILIAVMSATSKNQKSS